MQEKTDCIAEFHDLVRHPLAVEIRKQMVKAIAEYNLIENKDRVLVAVSGGKDSTIMLLLLNEIQRRAPHPFELAAVLLDQKQPGFNADEYKDWLNSLGITLTILQQDTYTIVLEKTPENKAFCSMCSRLRRGILYTYANEQGCTKIALGHHRDDLQETLLLNLFYSGKLATMPPKLHSKDGLNTVIRPLTFVSESDLQELSKLWQIPTLPCNLCGSQPGLKRKEVKDLLLQLRDKIPDIDASMLSAMGNPVPSHLL